MSEKGELLRKNWKIKLKRALYIITHYFELKTLDDLYSMTDMGCWMLFPSSFYLTHTIEEIKQSEKETRERIEKQLDSLE